MKTKNLELGRRLNLIITILICVIITPIFIIFLIYPDFLIPNYNYTQYGPLYIIYVIVFIFLFILTIGINIIVKRYIERSLEEKINAPQEINPSKRQSSNSNKGDNLKYCSSCGAEILDKEGDFCSKCGTTIK